MCEDKTKVDATCVECGALCWHPRLDGGYFYCELFDCEMIGSEEEKGEDECQ